MKKIFLLFPLLTLGIFGTAFCSEKKASAVNPNNTNQSEQKNIQVILKTTMGDITLELYPEIAPKTVENFIGLAKGTKKFNDPKNGKQVSRPYYDGIIFHRIISNFMIQGGDILGNGTGGPGYQFEDEISATALGLDKKTLADLNKKNETSVYIRDIQNYVLAKMNIRSQEQLRKKQVEAEAELQKILQSEEVTVADILETAGYNFQNQLKSIPVKKYTIAMANAGPNTNGSQFFINLRDNEYLNGKHTVFGKVVQGFDVVDKMGMVKTDSMDRPLQEVKITKVVIKN